jgi:hypothetical protein
MRQFLLSVAAVFAATLSASADDAKNLGRFDPATDDGSEDVAWRTPYGRGYYHGSYGYNYRPNFNYGYGGYRNYGYANYGYRNFGYGGYSYRNYGYSNYRPYYGYGRGWCGISDDAPNAAVTVTLALKGIEPVQPATRNDPLYRAEPRVEPAPAVTKPVEDLKVSLPAAKSKYAFPAYGEK